MCLNLERQDEGVRLWAEFRDAEDAELFLVQDAETLRFSVSEEPTPSPVSHRKVPLAALLDIVRERGSVAAAQVMAQFGVARNTAKAVLEEAANAGVLDSAPASRGGLSYFLRGG